MTNQETSALDARAQIPEDGEHWVELEPRPAGPGEVQILRHWAYTGPTLADVYERLENPPPEQPIPKVSAVEDPDRPGVLQVEFSIQLSEDEWEAAFGSN